MSDIAAPGRLSNSAGRLWNLADAHREALVGFTRRLVRTPSLSGQEGDVAALVQAEMRRLEFDAVTADAVGNVVGRVRGGEGRTVMLLSHLDQVDVGDHVCLAEARLIKP